jgi:hypothetical protein
LGKANTVPVAISKGQDKAKRDMFDVPMRDTTIPHEILGKFESSSVMLKPPRRVRGLSRAAPCAQCWNSPGSGMCYEGPGLYDRRQPGSGDGAGAEEPAFQGTIEQSRGVKITL